MKFLVCSEVPDIWKMEGAGKVVLGAECYDATAFALDSIEVRLLVDGEILTGSTGNVMGHPSGAVAWLANKLAELDGLGGHLQKGDIVMSGSCTRSVSVGAGSKLQATFVPMGAIDIEFV